MFYYARVKKRGNFYYYYLVFKLEEYFPETLSGAGERSFLFKLDCAPAKTVPSQYKIKHCVNKNHLHSRYLTLKSRFCRPRFTSRTLKCFNWIRFILPFCFPCFYYSGKWAGWNWSFVERSVVFILWKSTKPHLQCEILFPSDDGTLKMDE